MTDLLKVWRNRYPFVHGDWEDLDWPSMRKRLEHWANTNPVIVFVYWMIERERIRYRKETLGKPAPWTNDRILQEYRFCNVFRIRDKVTRQYLERLPAMEGNPLRVFWSTCVFRYFNLANTYDAIQPIFPWKGSETRIVDGTPWIEPRKNAKKVLSAMHRRGEQMFTGAYIVTNAGRSEPKWKVSIDVLDRLWPNVPMLLNTIMARNTLQHAVEMLATQYNIGRFTAYEIATDLSYTTLLNEAHDLYTWANAGPGAVRGLNRIHGRPLGGSLYVSNAEDEMRALYEMMCEVVQYAVNDEVEGDWPILTMREIEHSLCEFDKYMRVLQGEGRPRARYNGTGE